VGLRVLWNGLRFDNGLQQLLGGAIALAALAVAVAAARRARFHTGGGGAGVVVVTEGRITYLGPVTGGSVSLASMLRIEIVDEPDGGRVWVLRHADGPALRIPVAAEGAEALFDAFAALPGLDPARLVAALTQRPGRGRPPAVWSRALPTKA
jgi:hypothetical protein